MNKVAWGILSFLMLASLAARAGQIEIKVFQGPTTPEEIAAWKAGGVFKQRLEVYVDGEYLVTYPTSTGIGIPVIDDNGFPTQTSTHPGEHPVTMLDIDHTSSQYRSGKNSKKGAPMPYAIRFHDSGQWVHQTKAPDGIEKLGKPASHGCVRLNEENAAELFNLVQENAITDAGPSPIYTAKVTVYGVVPIKKSRMKANFEKIDGELLARHQKALAECTVKGPPPGGADTIVVYERIYKRDKNTGIFLPENSQDLNNPPADYAERCPGAKAEDGTDSQASE